MCSINYLKLSTVNVTVFHYQPAPPGPNSGLVVFLKPPSTRSTIRQPLLIPRSQTNASYFSACAQNAPPVYTSLPSASSKKRWLVFQHLALKSHTIFSNPQAKNNSSSLQSHLSVTCLLSPLPSPISLLQIKLLLIYCPPGSGGNLVAFRS